MAERRGPLYLARASYRRRRLIDALRLLPFLMFGLWLLPLLWGGEGTDRPVGAGSRAFLHVFVVWALGLIAAAWLARHLARGEASDLASQGLQSEAEAEQRAAQGPDGEAR